MRLLDRYLLRELLVPLAYCLCGFLIFWISFDLLGQMDEFQMLRMRGKDVLQYYIARLPELMVLVLPVALLLALLYALTNHARHHELTAIRAAGVGIWRSSVPYLATGLLFSILVGFLSEWWAPRGAEWAERIKLRRSASSAPADQRDWRANLRFQNSRDRRAWVIGAYNVVTMEMRNPLLDWRMADGSRRLIHAESAVWTNRAWVFSNVKESRYAAERDSTPKIYETNQMVLPELTETPDLIRSEVRVSSLSSIRAAKGAQLSIKEIEDYFQLHPTLDAKQRALLSTQLHARLAAPVTCLVVVLIAIPFGAASGRRNLFVGVASSIFICFGYFMLQRFTLALGTGGYIPPWVAAWAPNVTFGVLGGVFIGLSR